MTRAFFLAATVLTALPFGIASAVTVESNRAITGHEGATPIITIKLDRTKPPVAPSPSQGVAGASGLLPPDRNASANWSSAGMLSVGGIPTRTTICTTVKQLGSAKDETTNIQIG